MSNNDLLRCSFCGKMAKDVLCLVAGPAVYICDECTYLCLEIVQQQLRIKHIKLIKEFKHMWE